MKRMSIIVLLESELVILVQGIIGFYKKGKYHVDKIICKHSSIVRIIC